MSQPIGILANLPRELKYLARPAMRYGIYQFDDDVAGFLERASNKDIATLSRVSERIDKDGHVEAIQEFLDHYPISQYRESARLYFLLGLLEAISEPDAGNDWNTVDNLISDLQRHGSFRLASERMWAARFLADFGQEAGTAIPQLRIAVSDEDLRVRVWAHFALAAIEGDVENHKQAIQEILAKCTQGDSLQDDEVLLACEVALSKLAELRQRH